MTALRENLGQSLGSPSLRRRLVLWTVLVALLIQSALAALAYYTQFRAMDDMFNARLTTRATLIKNRLTSTEKVPSDDDLRYQSQLALLFFRVEEFAVGLYDTDGRVIAATRRPIFGLDAVAWSPSTKDYAASSRRMQFAHPLDPGVPWPSARVATVSGRLPDGTRTVLVVATTDYHFRDMMSVTGRGIFYGLIGGIVATSVAAWIVAGIALRPLRAISVAAGDFLPQTPRPDDSARPWPAELAEFQHQLATARERLRQSLSAQDRLISNLSHEMKTPIAVLLTEAETLDTASLTPDGQSFVRSVRQEMRRLGATIDTFVLLSRLRDGGPLPESRPCDVNDAMLRAVNASMLAANRLGVVVRVEAAEGPVPPLVHGGEELLASMIGHVLRNSILASGPNDEVFISVGIQGEHVRVSIRDGRSKPGDLSLESIHNHLSDHQVACDDRRDIGLTIARGIAELHRGVITVRSVGTPGCEFIIDLPRFAEHRASVSAAASNGTSTDVRSNP